MLKVKGELEQVMYAQWREMRADLKALKAEVRHLALQQRAEVAGSAPTYANLAAFPAAGQGGRWAFALDTGKMYFDSGSVWKEITTV